MVQQQGGQVLSIPAPAGGMASIPGPPRVQFAQPAGPGGPAGPLQFLPIPLMTSTASHVQPHQNLLGAPLSSFLPQSYFAPRGAGGGAGGGGGGGGGGAGTGGGGATIFPVHMAHPSAHLGGGQERQCLSREWQGSVLSCRPPTFRMKIYLGNNLFTTFVCLCRDIALHWTKLMFPPLAY